MLFIKELKDLSRDDVAIAGGKGASLGEMIRASLPVPAGFVVSTDAFWKFLTEADLKVAIDSILHTIDRQKMHTVEDAAEKIQSLMLQAEMPSEVAAEALAAFKSLGAKFVAVRSSAMSEDGAAAAWAGQLQSFLNVTEDDLLSQIKKCWASLFTARAIFYSLENNLHGQTNAVAVVVQKMVASDTSGVAFSVHPVTQDANQMIIEAGFGLGEAIVSGRITPDSYVVEKNLWFILDKSVSKQVEMLVRATAGGDDWRPVVEAARTKQKLSDQEIIKLAKLVQKVEKYFGFPVDVEWAKEKGKFFITQSRPITTLSTTTEPLKLIDYIKAQRWFFGIRAEEALLFYSAKQAGCNKFLPKEHGLRFAETMLVPVGRHRPLRVFNLWQAKSFHAVSNKKILRRPQLLSDYIARDELTYQQINLIGKKLLAAIKQDDADAAVRFFKKSLLLYERAGADFFIIFSLGLKLAENVGRLKGVKNVMKKHDVWRNAVAFKEEALEKCWSSFLQYITERQKIKIKPQLLMKFLTADEIGSWLDGKLSLVEIKQRINLRRKNDYIYLNLRHDQHEVIDDPSEVALIRKHFLQLAKESKKSKRRDLLSGQTVYGSGSITGQVVIIKDKFELKDKSQLIAGKILVAIQTTPHFIPYMKKARAVITDEGGLTCHAAIVARELKIPCIVGTKIATQVLSDDDSVELDLDRETVKKLKISA